jgi:hypothetical protein
MAAAQTTVGSFLAALHTQMHARLAADPAFNKVKVWIAPPPVEEQPDGDMLILVRDKIPVNDKLATASEIRSRDENPRVPSVVQAYSTTREGGDVAFAQAINRAEAILEQLIAELRDNVPQVGRQTRSGLVSNITWIPIAGDKGGWIVRGEFEISYSARVS